MQLELYGDDAVRSDIARSLHQLGAAQGALRRHDDACESLQQALDMYRRVGSVARFIGRVSGSNKQAVANGRQNEHVGLRAGAQPSAVAPIAPCSSTKAGVGSAAERMERMQRDTVLSTAKTLHVLGMVQHNRGPASHNDALVSLLESLRIKRQLKRDLRATGQSSSTEGDLILAELSLTLHQLALLHRSRGGLNLALIPCSMRTTKCGGKLASADRGAECFSCNSRAGVRRCRLLLRQVGALSPRR